MNTPYMAHQHSGVGHAAWFWERDAIMQGLKGASCLVSAELLSSPLLSQRGSSSKGTVIPSGPTATKPFFLLYITEVVI